MIPIKNPNGYGTIRHYKDGRRREPYIFFVSKKVLQPDGTMKNKQVRVKSFATIKEARKFQAEYNENPFDPLRANITFNEVCIKYILPDIEKIKTRTKALKMAAYKKCQPLYDMKIREIRFSHIKSLLESYSHLSATTIMQLKVFLNQVFSYCLQDELISRNPVANQKVKSEQKPTERTAFTREEVQLIRDNLDYIVRPNASEQRKCFSSATPMMDTLLILIYTGLRVDELLCLKNEHIHLEERYMEVFGTKTDNADRLVPIHKDIIPFIEKRMSGIYLIGDEDEKVTYNQYKRSFWTPMCKHFGFDHQIHETRHTFSSFTALCNFNPVLRAKIIGHETGSITNDVYTHVFIEDIVKEIDKLVI